MPEGDLYRAWIYQLRRIAQDYPLPGQIRINVGLTPVAAEALQRALRRDGIPTEAVDHHGKVTYRMVLDGVMFEWLAPKPRGRL